MAAKQWQIKIGIAVALIIVAYFAYKRKLGPFGMPEVQELLGGKPETPTAAEIPQLVAGGDVPGAAVPGAGAVPSPNQFQGPSAPIGTGALSGPQIKPDENVRQTFLREMYKQVYLPFSDYPFLYDNPSFLNQTGTPVRGGDLPPCAPTDDAWFDMWYKLYGFYPQGSTSNLNCNPNPFPNPVPPVPQPACPPGFKADRCNCFCIPHDTIEIQSLCPEAERCPFPQVLPTPIPDTPGGPGTWTGACDAAKCDSEHQNACWAECIGKWDSDDCRKCRGLCCGKSFEKPHAGKTCKQMCDPFAHDNISGNYELCRQQCRDPPIQPPPPRPQPPPPSCRYDRDRCKGKYHGKCDTECRRPTSSDCKGCLCSCYGRTNYAKAMYTYSRAATISTPGIGYAFRDYTAPEGVLLQRANAARIHIA